MVFFLNDLPLTLVHQHCDKFNFTGAIIGVSVATKSVITYFSTEISPYLPQDYLTWNSSSGQGGIWMGGTGLSTDTGKRLFFTTVSFD